MPLEGQSGGNCAEDIGEKLLLICQFAQAAHQSMSRACVCVSVCTHMSAHTQRLTRTDGHTIARVRIHACIYVCRFSVQTVHGTCRPKPAGQLLSAEANLASELPQFLVRPYFQVSIFTTLSGFGSLFKNATLLF